MKELSIKQKAKDIETVKQMIADGHISQDVAEKYFPELKESEDVLTWLKNYISEEAKCLSMDIRDNDDRITLKKLRDSLVWLEKHSESDETKAKVFLINKGYPIDTNGIFPTYEEMYNIIREGLENQGEQKSTDKVEPKFKVGDWVIDKIVGGVWHIDSFDKKNYQVSDGKGNYNYFPISKQDEMHLWSIADAKDGDVLTCYSDIKGRPIEQTGIIKQYVGRHGGCSNTFKAYFGVDWDNNVVIDGFMGSTNIFPATKEQRELLFAKMKEAGYEWDAENKKLRTI